MDTDDPKPFVVSYMEALASTEDLSELASRWPPLVKIKHDLDARLPDGKVLKAVMLGREQAVALVEYIRRLEQLIPGMLERNHRTLELMLPEVAHVGNPKQ